MMEREGYPGGCMTASGVMFYPLDPRPEDIRIEDIAHALALVNRYGGHTRWPYCPTLDQRILTADLRWVLAGDVCVGDELLAFDEYPSERGSAGKLRRRYRASRVLAASTAKRQIIRLEMSDGSFVRASIEHPWLVATKQSRNQTWQTSLQLLSAIRSGHRRYMHRFIEPWTSLCSYDIGWLSGMYDGEGHLSTAARKGVQLGIAQRPGIVLDRLVVVLGGLGFKSLRWAQKEHGCVCLQMLGGWRDVARLLGSVRPVRLLYKFVELLRAGQMSKQMDGRGEPLEIVCAYKEADEDVAEIETSTRTYLCEGFGAHNSVAQHSVLVSDVMGRMINGTRTLALYGLLHDAAEYVLGDVPRPLKKLPAFAAYREAEARLQAMIYQAFLPKTSAIVGEPPELKVIDRRMLRTEQAVLMPPAAPREDRTDVPVLDGVWIGRWTFEKARTEFLRRFEALHD